MKPRPFVVSWAIFPFDVAVFLGGYPHADVIRWVERRTGEVLTEEERSALVFHGVGKCSILSGGITVLQVKNPTDNGIIAHESLHASNFVLRRVGVATIDDEVQAYMVSYLVREIDRKRKPKRKK